MAQLLCPPPNIADALVTLLLVSSLHQWDVRRFYFPYPTSHTSQPYEVTHICAHNFVGTSPSGSCNIGWSREWGLVSGLDRQAGPTLSQVPPGPPLLLTSMSHCGPHPAHRMQQKIISFSPKSFPIKFGKI